MPKLKIIDINAECLLPFEDIEINDFYERLNFKIKPNDSGKINFVKNIHN